MKKELYQAPVAEILVFSAKDLLLSSSDPFLGDEDEW